MFGYACHYRDILENNGIESVSERRQRLLDKFVIKTRSSGRYADKWFPQKEFIHYDLRKELVYEEKFARTKRLYDRANELLNRRSAE